MGGKAPDFGVGTKVKLPVHCPWALTWGLIPALLASAEEARQVQSWAQGGPVPKDQAECPFLIISPQPVFTTANAP